MRGATRDPQRDLTRALAGVLREGFPLDQKDLPDVREVEGRIERGTAPDAPRLNASVIGWRDLDEGGSLTRLKPPRDLALQRGLVPLDGEVIVGLSLDDIGGQRTLGQQGLARHVRAGEGPARQQGDRHADFVGALLRLPARYGEGADFFGV